LVHAFRRSICSDLFLRAVPNGAGSKPTVATDLRRKEQLPELTKRIVETYGRIDTINHLGHCPLPNYEVVVGVIEDLKEILFPGFRRREGLHLGNVLYHVGDLIDGLHDKLTVQISRALRHEAGRIQVDDGETDFDALGQAKAIEFLEHIPDLRQRLALDVQAAFEGDPSVRGLDEIIFCYPGLEAITVYRLAHILYEMDIPLIPRMMSEWAHSRTGIDIHPGAVIGQTCEIGNRVKLYQGVTLGALSFQTDGEGNLVRGTKRHPTLEDGVVIYANATVLGGATVVGRNSVIGSSVWLTRSVDPHTTVVLEKPKLRMRAENQTETFDGVLDYQI